MNPEKLNKYLYIESTPTWAIRAWYVVGIIVWLPILFVTLLTVGTDVFTTWFVTPIILILSVHYLPSFALNLFYKRFDIKKHHESVATYWNTGAQPSVDIFLPICGEGMEVLENTWKHVSRIDYANKKVYVLDDSTHECEEHKQLAERFGFSYIARPNKGEMKKAGNMKYAYERTDGEFIVVLDGDFAPHTDFLKELLPYTTDPRVGIVQSPQYFPLTKEVHKRGPLAYGAARAQEVFYRVIQVARDRFDGAHCCGTCAVYRRAALSSIGGFVQMGHSEDAHTGFTLTAKGWVVRYVPVILSIGLCPENPHAFFHQQHRWCLGNMLMMLSKKFWAAPISWRAKYSYITGYLFYLHQPFVILFSFQLFWTLFVYNEYISFAAGLPFYPHVIWAFAYMFFFYTAPFRWGYLYAILMRSYAYCHAMATVMLGRTVGWIPTGAKTAGVSAAFRQTMLAVSLYIFAYIALIALAVREDKLHLLEISYYSVQFWMFWNLALSGVLLWQLYRTTAQVKEEQYMSGATARLSFVAWQAKTIGLYLILLVGGFCVIAYA